MAKAKQNVAAEELIEIKKLAGQAGEQLANKDYEGAWKTFGALNNLYKEHKDSLSPAVNDLLSGAIKKYYYQNKKYNSAVYGMQKIGETLSETATMIKTEK